MSRTVILRATLASSLTAVVLALVLTLTPTQSAFSRTTDNASSSFGAASDFRNYVLTEDFSTNVTSGWNTSRWNNISVNGAVVSATSGFGRYQSSSTYLSSLRMTSITTPTDFTDQGVYLRHRFNTATANGLVLRIGVRCSTNFSGDTATDCYWIEFGQGASDGGSILLQKGGDGERFAGTTAISGTNWWQYRLEVVGQQVRYKRWADGAAEPTTWNNTVNVGSGNQQTSGRLLLEALYYSGTAGALQDFDDIKYYTL